MLRRIGLYGGLAGLIIGVPMLAMVSLLGEKGPTGPLGLAIGYTSMLIALSVIFVAVKRHRDEALGGAIKFLPAFALGLGISVVASVIYAFAWEASLAVSGMDYGALHAEHAIAAAKAKGVAGAELAKLEAKMADFQAMYANPLMRIPITISEMLPVGLIVSLIVAGLVRNPKFWPVRR